MAKFLKDNLLLLLILFAAFIMRFLLIDTLPGGLFPDEAANGLDVNSILNGDWYPFYERGNGREALFFYVIAAVVSVFGRGVWQHHVVSAGFGFLAVIAAYFLTKRLFGKNAALLAAFLMATSSYAVTISRTAFRANLVPLFATLTILFIVKIYQERQTAKKYWAAALAGLSFALGFYTYISYRVMIPLLAGFKLIIWYGIRDRWHKALREYWKPKLIAAAAFVIAIFPLAHYFITHPGAFVGRAGHVSIFSNDLNHGDIVGTFLEVFKLTMLSFFTAGDTNWRHNVSGYPFLSPLVSPFFAVGLIIFTLAGFKLLHEAYKKQIREKTLYMALVAAWFWLMLAPEVTTAEGIPHGLRMIGVIPPIFIMAGWVINEVWKRLKSRLPMYSTIIAIIFLGAIFLYNFCLYFGVARSSPEYYKAFRSDLTVVSDYLNTRATKNSTYLSLDEFWLQTVDYLTTTTGNPYIKTDPASTYRVRLKKGDQVVFTQSTLFDRLKFLKSHPRAELVRQELNQFGEIVMLVYEQK